MTTVKLMKLTNGGFERVFTGKFDDAKNWVNENTTINDCIICVEFPTFDAPARWASALVNCDDSGLTDQDKQELRNFLERENLSAGSCVACSEHSLTGKFDGLLTELFEYTFDTRKEFLPCE